MYLKPDMEKWMDYKFGLFMHYGLYSVQGEGEWVMFEKPIARDEYAKIVAAADSRGDATIGHIERFKFYEEAKTAYAIIATSEAALYANVMLQKGVI